MDQEILHAVAADVLSTLLVFNVFVGLVVSEAGDLDSAILGALYLGIWGSIFLIPLGLISLTIAAVSATVTSLAKRAVRKYR